jgi:hypothetical protein
MGTLELNRAESVLTEAVSHGVITAMPEDEKVRIKTAEELVNYAQVQFEQFHNREPSVCAILFANGTQPEGKEKLEENSSRKEADTSTEIREDAGIPKADEESALDLVVDDFTSLSDVELRKLHSQFNAIASRTAFQHMHEENAALDCKLVANEREDKLIRPLMDGKKTKSLLLSEVSNDKELVKWRERQHNHEKHMRHLKTEYDVAISNVERISREWSMRSQERNGSGQLPTLTRNMLDSKI